MLKNGSFTSVLTMPIIECYGLPGSGKSYVQKRLKDYLILKGFDVVSRDEFVIRGLSDRDDGPITNVVKKFPASLWHRVIHEDYCLQEVLDFLGAYSGLGALLFQILNQAEITAEHRRSILGAYAKTFVEYQLACKSHEQGWVLVADEWFCHRFYTLFGNCAILPDRDQTTDFAEQIPVADIAVFIAASPELSIDRMHDRDRFPEFLQPLSTERIKEIMRVGYEGFENLTDQLEHRETNIIVYDGLSSVEGVAIQCEKYLTVLAEHE